MNKAKTINIALIGYGFVGKTFHAPLIQSIEGLTLAVVSSRDEEKVKRDLPDVLVVATPEEAIQHPDVDLVVIASQMPPTRRWQRLPSTLASTWWWISHSLSTCRKPASSLPWRMRNSVCSPSSTTAAGTAISSALSR